MQLVLKPEYHETIRNVEKYLEYIDKDESVSKAARFSHTELDKLYDELCFKAENSIYKKRPANQSATLKMDKNFSCNNEFKRKSASHQQYNHNVPM